MLYVDLPTGSRHGWGVVGDNLANALAAVSPVVRLGDDSVAPPRQIAPLLQAVTRPHLRPKRPSLAYARHLGYAVFEHDLEARRAAVAVRGLYDVLVTASRWAEQTLREGGLTTTLTIHHGVDRARFNPHRATRRRDDDSFVIFSGGKFELRKGQDVVVRAFRAFAERHRDARLIAAWHNAWPHLAATMYASPHLAFAPREAEPQNDALARWLVEAGIDLRRVELIQPLQNADLAPIYGQSDVGLFPSRCEGSTNLVMMEYMACGRAVIATDFSGHRDVLNNHNSLPLRRWRPFPIIHDNTTVACFCEPDLEEIVERLEQAYRERDRLALLGQRAAFDMLEWTWERAARQFLAL